MTKLFVASLPWKTTDQDLFDLFDQYGKVLSAKVILDHETGKSRGFGFVEMDNDIEARETMDKVNGQEFNGRRLVVTVAKPKVN